MGGIWGHMKASAHLAWLGLGLLCLQADAIYRVLAYLHYLCEGWPIIANVCFKETYP